MIACPPVVPHLMLPAGESNETTGTHLLIIARHNEFQDVSGGLTLEVHADKSPALRPEVPQPSRRNADVRGRRMRLPRRRAFPFLDEYQSLLDQNHSAAIHN